MPKHLPLSSRSLFALVGMLLVAASLRAQGFGYGGNPGTWSFGNIVEWGFENNLCTPFTDGSSGTCTTGQGRWTIDSVSPAALGTRSIRATYPVCLPSPCNVGAAFYYVVSPTRTTIYVRWAYKQQDPFNSNGRVSNQDTRKMLRFYNPGYNSPNLGSLLISGQRYILFGEAYDHTSSWTANCNAPAPLPNKLLGGWHWFELYLDISNDARHVYVKVWVDGKLYQNHDFAQLDSGCGPGSRANPNWIAGNGSNRIGTILFDGTINSMASPSADWFDQIGVSSAYMGVPGSSSTP